MDDMANYYMRLTVAFKRLGREWIDGKAYVSLEEVLDAVDEIITTEGEGDGI